MVLSEVELVAKLNDGRLEIEIIPMRQQQDVTEQVGGLVFQRLVQRLVAEITGPAAPGIAVPDLSQFTELFLKLQYEPVLITLNSEPTRIVFVIGRAHV